MWFLLSCMAPDVLPIYVTAETAPVFRDYIDFMGDDRLLLQEVADPETSAKGFSIAILTDLDCAECFKLERQEDRFLVHGGAPLGVQYGLSRLFENLGYRFWHPNDCHRPATLEPVDVEETQQEPSIARRGLHLHTLHPIEGLDAFWLQKDDTEARRVMDWLIKNGGNHLQWVALNDILTPSVHDEWSQRTAILIDDAHTRGLTVGLGIQLYGTSNLQQAYDLIDQPGEDEAGQVAERIELVTKGLPWDLLNLSFGEFSGAEPQTFIDSVNLAYAEIQRQAPGTEVPATIHVGNYPDLQVDYQGQQMLYYFLVQFADPGIEPWIHTVMYYNLFEDAGGAYLHDDFSVHRQFLLDHLSAGQPIGYFPETAYWVAFDDSVPQYLPLYIRSRWTDLKGIEAVAPLPDHQLFSSGWEWGYWQNDAAALRMGWHRDEDWTDIVRDFFAPLGQTGTAEAVISLANLQHDALIDGRLTPYLSGRDAFMDLGDTQGIIAAPTRPTVAEILAMSSEERAAFRTSVVVPLQNYSDAIRAIPLPIVPDSSNADRRAVQEVVDGMQVDAERAAFAAALWGAVADAGDGLDSTTGLKNAETALEAGQIVVSRRHQDFHLAGPWADKIWDNPTIYHYGYLQHADQLCFWHREMIQARNVLTGTNESVPTCAL